MKLRILLPPTLAACVQRNAVPVKVEVDLGDGKPVSPERAGAATFAALPDAHRAAAFALSRLCGGEVGAFLQLDKKQLAEMVELLRGETAFFFADTPKISIPWQEARNGKLGLIGVSELVEEEKAEAVRDTPQRVEVASESRNNDEEEDDTPSEEAWLDYRGSPIEVEGSTEYVLVQMPSSGHPGHKRALRILREANFLRDKRNRYWWWLRGRDKTLDFLAEYREEFENDLRAVFTDNFLEHVKSIRSATLQTRATENEAGAEVMVTIQAGEAPPALVEQALATGANHVESDGKVYLFGKGLLAKAHALQKRLTGSPDAPLLGQGAYRIPREQTTQAEELIAEADPGFKPPETWQARSAALRNFSKLPPPPLPPEPGDVLRPYQKIGTAWLLHLFRHRLGGILADEMGLGKTVQALALLACLKEEKDLGDAHLRASLVVCPASLVENWRREAVRFCPQLKTFVHHGSKRLSSPEEIAAHDIVVTSYGTFVRDLALFAAAPLLCIVGDEAQHLKNRRAQAAKALTKLSARGRFLLTGTPVENSPDDLRSLLNFLMPGALLPVPNGSRGDERAWHERRFLAQAAPYVLRRAKEAVAPELPEKIEQVVYVRMTPEQAKTYAEVKKVAEREIASLEEAGTPEGVARVKALAQLLRLRRTCCDPRLLDDSLLPKHSAKLAAFGEILDSALDSGSRLLVFSQFTSLLALVRRELDDAGLSYCYLDGSTRDRQAQVDRFQNDASVPLFLLSLKAGGTGLNLTGADQVVHFDPWWNPAAEAQATDRAHRIGQTRTVHVHKLIVSDSVEENVLLMQGRKKKLLQDLFEAAEAANAPVNVDDLKELI